MKTQIKICGITTRDDAQMAQQYGADFIGIIVAVAGTPRSVTAATAAAIRAGVSVPVVILVEKPAAHILDALAHIRPAGVQLIGDYADEDIRMIKRTAGCAVWKSVHLPPGGGTETTAGEIPTAIERCADAGIDVVVLDTRIKNKKGGTGITCDWQLARTLVARSRLPVFLAGGITPHNIGAALAQVRPCGIDVSSGVEQRPGEKDPEKIALLMQQLRACDARRLTGDA